MQLLNKYNNKYTKYQEKGWPTIVVKQVISSKGIQKSSHPINRAQTNNNLVIFRKIYSSNIKLKSMFIKCNVKVPKAYLYLTIVKGRQELKKKSFLANKIYFL